MAKKVIAQYYRVGKKGFGMYSPGSFVPDLWFKNLYEMRKFATEKGWTLRRCG